MSYADGTRPDGRVDAKRFAEAAGVAYGTVKRWLHEGMPCERIGNRVWIDIEEAGWRSTQSRAKGARP